MKSALRFAWVVLVFCTLSEGQAALIEVGSAEAPPAPLAQETQFRDPRTGEKIWAMPVNVEMVDGAIESRGPVLSLQFQGPLNLSLGMGWVFGTRETVSGAWAVVRKGLVIESKAGLGGGQVGAGYIWESFMVAVPVGFDLKASYLRTWGYTVGPAGPSENYAGAELDLMMTFVKLTAGVFRQFGKDPAVQSPDWLFVWGAGLGF